MKIQPRSILEEKIRTIIDDQTYNAYLCGREWPAWEAGTMTKDDFTKFSDGPRFEELVSDIMEAACGSPAKEAAALRKNAHEMLDRAKSLEKSQ